LFVVQEAKYSFQTFLSNKRYNEPSTPYGAPGNENGSSYSDPRKARG
jgi:hypothetical protein